MINGDEGARILQEIEFRRADQFRREYDFFNADESPEQQTNRFNLLRAQLN